MPPPPRAVSACATTDYVGAAHARRLGGGTLGGEEIARVAATHVHRATGVEASTGSPTRALSPGTAGGNSPRSARACSRLRTAASSAPNARERPIIRRASRRAVLLSAAIIGRDGRIRKRASCEYHHATQKPRNCAGTAFAHRTERCCRFVATATRRCVSGWPSFLRRTSSASRRRRAWRWRRRAWHLPSTAIVTRAAARRRASACTAKRGGTCGRAASARAPSPPSSGRAAGLRAASSRCTAGSGGWRGSRRRRARPWRCRASTSRRKELCSTPV